MADDNKFKKFIEPSFKGLRFDRHTMPVETLAEIEAYAALVEAVAQDIYFQENSERTRLPKGFKNKFRLDLSTIKEGSAIPVLQREYSDDSANNDEFDRARDLINDAIKKVTQGQASGLPSNVIPLFLKFGRSLKDDEAIELTTPGTTSPAIYTKAVRLNVLSSESAASRKEVCVVSGSISGFEASKGTFNIITEDGRTVSGRLDSTFDPTIREVATRFKKNLENELVTLIGCGQYKPDMSLQEIERVQHCILFRDGKPHYFPDPNKRLDEIKALNDNWYNGKSKKFVAADIIKTKTFLENILKSANIPAPFLYPSPDSAVEAEWSFGMWEVGLSFSFSEAYVSAHAVRTDSEELREDKFRWDDPKSPEKAVTFLLDLLKIQEL